MSFPYDNRTLDILAVDDPLMHNRKLRRCMHPLKGFFNQRIVRYVSAVCAIGLAFLLRIALSLIAGPDFPEYLVFYPTVMIVALLAGVGPALLASVVSAIFVALWILPGPRPFTSARAANYVGLGLFVGVCAFLSVVAELYRRSRQKAAAYDKEQALRESHEALRQQAELLKLSFDAIIVRRMDSGIESWNRGAEELYGWSENEALGRATYELLSTAQTIPWSVIVSVLRERGHWEGELRYQTREGREVIVSSRQHIGRGLDGTDRVLEIDRDITDRKRVQEELQRAHDKLEENVRQRTFDLQRANRMLRMISMCDQAVVQISDERELMQVICQIIQDESGYPLVWVGLEEKETKTVRCAALAGDHDDFLHGIGATAGDCSPESDPAGRAIRSGAPIVWDDIARQCECPSLREAALRKGFRSMAALPLMNAQKTAFSALIIYSERLPGFDQDNIDLLKELVDDLAFGIMSLRARAERDQAQLALEIKASQLQILAAELVRSEERERRRIAQLLHDHLQQLLAAVLYGLESLRTAPGNAAVQEGVTKLSGLLRECIDMSHSLTSELSHPALSEPDLRAALQWLASWAREKYGLEVEVEAAAALIVASEETRVMLLQAVRELLFNVVKHAGVKAARVRLSQARDGRVLITVSDEGVGFDPARMNGLGGASSGIGLFSIRERLALTGGGMELEGTPGGGSSFTLWVPGAIAGPPPESATSLAPGKAGKAEARPRSKKPRRAASRSEKGRIRVLLVDDHMVVRDGLAVQLGQQPDIEIVGEASDGMTALELVRRLQPDVVTMDVNMPGMNGIEATRAILAEFPGMSVIGLSMFEGTEKATAMRAAGALDYLSKSASFDSLLAAIRACARNL